VNQGLAFQQEYALAQNGANWVINDFSKITANDFCGCYPPRDSTRLVPKQTRALSHLRIRLPVHFFQVIKTRGAVSNVGEQVGKGSMRRGLCEFQQDFVCWTADALRIRKISMHYPLKGLEQFSFRIHSPRSN